jgi:DNA-binding IclR family transcriptional regulator
MANAKTLGGAAGTAEAVLVALAKTGEATVAEVADVAGMGRSTASKALASLEADGKARRVPGGRDGGRRRPDRWSVAAPARKTRPAPKKTGASEQAAGSGDRLRPGALGDLVADYLRANGGEPLGPTAVGKGLGRSQGAVANALARLAEAGTVVCVSESPRRYRLAE